MSVVSVMVKTGSGLVMPCTAHPTKDGCFWECAFCRTVCCRVSFGMMNGLWRCECGREIEVTVDDHEIDLKNLQNVDIQREPAPADDEQPEPAPIKDDDTFLKSCGIAAEDEPKGG